MNPKKISQVTLLGAWLIALIAMISTLYASEILAIPTCVLCWYQRIGIYPLTLILGIALYRQDHHIYIYAIPLAAVAALFAMYQYLQQMNINILPTIEFCSPGAAACSQTHIKLLGFITFPLLSFIASFTIVVLLMIGGIANKQP